MEGATGAGQARPGGGSGLSLVEGVAIVAGVAAAALAFSWWQARSTSATRTAISAQPQPSPTPKPTETPKVCRSCGKIESADQTLVRCGRCHKIYYCSRDCQRQDWGRHKSECTAPPAAQKKATAPTEPLPAWAQGLTAAEYAGVKALLKKNDEQFEQHLLQGGPRPDSVDDIWEGFAPEEAKQLIEDSIWYKEFHKTNDASRVPDLLRRLAAAQFFGSAPAAVSFFCAVFGQQSAETLRTWVDQHIATDLEQDLFRSAFLTFLRYGNTPACQECGQRVLELLPEAKKPESQFLLSMPIPEFVSDPLHQPLRTPQGVDRLWATYYATGNIELVKTLIKEGLPLGIQARGLAATQPPEAQLLMQTCNYVAVTLINEGIFDKQVRKACKTELKALSQDSGRQVEIMQMLHQILLQQQGSIQQLAAIPTEEVSRMRVEVEGHRPFIERVRELKHQQKVERLKQMPGVRAVPTQFGKALWLPSSADHPQGLLFMTMEDN